MIIFLVIASNCYSQKLYEFSYEQNKYEYLFLSKGKNNVLRYYVVISKTPVKTEELFQCLSNKYNRVYILNIPKAITDAKKEQEFFLSFMEAITSRTKLLESKLSVVSDGDYTSLYREMAAKDEHRYRYTYLNGIEALHIGKDKAEICRIINEK